MSNNRPSTNLPSTVLGGVLAGVYAVVGGLIALGGAAATTSGGAPSQNAVAGLSTGTGYTYPTAAPYPTPRVPVPSSPSAAEYQWVLGPGGLRLSIPVGWGTGPGQVSGNVQADAPGDAERFLRYGATPPPPNVGLLAEIEAGPRTNTSIQEQYRQISLTPIQFSGTQAVDWEFTYVKNGVTRHVHGYYWRANGWSYVIYASAPADRWSTMIPIFDTMARTTTTTG